MPDRCRIRSTEDFTSMTTTAKGGRMVLDGVLLDDRVVRDLKPFLERPLAKKLEQALFFSARIVALTHEERLAVLEALDRAPWAFEEVRELLLADHRWVGSARALQHSR